MKKYFLVSLLFLSACATTSNPFPPVTKEEKDQFSLDRILISVHDLHSAATRFQKDLGFTTADNKSMQAVFQDGSTLELEQQTGHEGVSEVRLRAASLDDIRIQAEQKQIPFQQSELKDASGKVYAQVLDFKNYEPLKLFSFIRYAKNYQPPTANHRNSALRLHEAWIAVDNLYAAEAELARIGFEYSGSRILQPLRVNAKAIQLVGSALVFVDRAHLEGADKTHLQGYGMEVVGISLQVRDIERFAKSLEREHRVRYATARYSHKSCILIPPQYTNGLWIEFAKPL